MFCCIKVNTKVSSDQKQLTAIFLLRENKRLAMRCLNLKHYSSKLNRQIPYHFKKTQLFEKILVNWWENFEKWEVTLFINGENCPVNETILHSFLKGKKFVSMLGPWILRIMCWEVFWWQLLCLGDLLFYKVVYLIPFSTKTNKPGISKPGKNHHKPL